MLSRTAHGDTMVAVTGSYLPPFGRIGAALDRVALHRVAHATVRGFLAQLADTATSCPDAGSDTVASAANTTAPQTTGAAST